LQQEKAELTESLGYIDQKLADQLKTPDFIPSSSSIVFGEKVLDQVVVVGQEPLSSTPMSGHGDAALPPKSDEREHVTRERERAIDSVLLELTLLPVRVL
jgi:hypothetical protein